MSLLRTVWLIAKREFRERIRSRAFQLSTVVILLIVGALIVVPALFDGGPPTWRVGVVGDIPEGLEAAVESAAPEPGTSVEVVVIETGAARSALTEGSADVVLTGGEILAAPDTDPALASTLATVVGPMRFAETAAALGLTSAQIEELLAAASPEVAEIAAERAEIDMAAVGAAFLASIILFVAIITYGQWILVGVVEEKASRVVEVLLGSVRPHHLLAGKVLGIGALGVAQLVLLGVVVAAANLVGETIELPDRMGTVVGIVVLWFVLGYGFYATAYAAAGSLVARVEDAQNAALPLTLVLMGGYFTAAFSLTGDNAVLTTASMIPAFAPMTMPVRMAAGTAAAWQVAVSIFLMVAGTWLLIRIAGRIYAGGLLRSRGRTKVREAWRSATG